MADEPQIEDVLDELYTRVDDLLLAGKFGEVDRELSTVDVDATDLTVLLGWLTITHAAHPLLPAREAFTAKVAARAERDHGQAEAVELMRGLFWEEKGPRK